MDNRRLLIITDKGDQTSDIAAYRVEGNLVKVQFNNSESEYPFDQYQPTGRNEEHFCSSFDVF